VTDSDELEEEYEEEESEIDIDDDGNIQIVKLPVFKDSGSENINFSKDTISRAPVVDQ
jgi:hypothetical protein